MTTHYPLVLAPTSDLECMADIAALEAESGAADSREYAETARGLRQILEQRRTRAADKEAA